MSKPADNILQAAREAATYLEGERRGFVAHVLDEVDVAAIRKRLDLSQASFARQFGLELSAVRNWEQRRRRPDASARALLMVIDREPEAVVRALSKRVGNHEEEHSDYASKSTDPLRPNVHP